VELFCAVLRYLTRHAMRFSTSFRNAPRREALAQVATSIVQCASAVICAGGNQVRIAPRHSFRGVSPGFA